MINYRKFFIICLLLSLLLATGCLSSWKITITDSNGVVNTITKQSVSVYIDHSIDAVNSVPLGQLLYASGYTLIDEITFTDKSGDSHTYNWDEIAEATTINAAGIIAMNEESLDISKINIVPSPLLNELSNSILDISPTVAYALDLPELPSAIGQNYLKYSQKFDRVVMILMDGVQYDKFSNMVDDHLLPFFGDHDNINMGLTVYPPITTTATAALLTSTTPDQNGVFGYGYRSTELTTIFDLATENGLSVIAIEGASLPFNLRNAETSLSGDQDGNGFSDDNVFSNSLETIQNNLPDLLYIHFHEIDDMGHSYGENSKKYEDAIIRVDTYIEQIYQSLPEQTLVIIFADHGMHTTSDGGNHGTLTAHDLIIPIIFITK